MNEQILSLIPPSSNRLRLRSAHMVYLMRRGQTVVVAFVMWLIPTVWGLYVRRKAGLVASAAALPEVREIRTTPEMARKVEDPSVTAG
ncbi:hypothetical protein GGC47_004617 [Bosea sp. OAE752]|uniref:hypothetical protein n=1 Tax=Bosea sp. OAE752 TaxID=2663873 RepID=UPI003D25EBD2